MGTISLYATGRLNGCILDSGFNVTTCTPIIDGYSYHSAITRMNIGGENITKYLSRILTLYGDYNFSTTSELQTIRIIKEKECILSSIGIDNQLNPQYNLYGIMGNNYTGGGVNSGINGGGGSNSHSNLLGSSNLLSSLSGNTIKVDHGLPEGPYTLYKFIITYNHKYTRETKSVETGINLEYDESPRNIHINQWDTSKIKANTIIYYDYEWDSIVNDNVNRFVNKINGHHEITIYRLINQNTIEDKIFNHFNSNNNNLSQLSVAYFYILKKIVALFDQKVQLFRNFLIHSWIH